MQIQHFKIGSIVHISGMLVFGVITFIVIDAWKSGLFGNVMWILVGTCILSQAYYLWRSSRIEKVAEYSDLETIDNEMVFAENDDDYEIVANTGVDIFLAIIAGVISVFFLVMVIVSLPRLIDSSWSSAVQVMTKLYSLWVGLGGIFTVIYNFRTYNAKGIK